MPPCTFEEARRVIHDRVLAAREPLTETVRLENAHGRVLAGDALADRDYPPLPRSIRDGYAVRSADLPGRLTIAGEIRAGEPAGAVLRPGQAIEIMTGAPVPDGADAVVMIEHTTRQGDAVIAGRAPRPGEFINPRGAEASQGETLLAAGARLGFPQIALLSTIGKTLVRVYRRPGVAIIPTGDEVVDVDAPVRPHQVRNSNARTLSVQVQRAGGLPVIFPVARDEAGHTRSLMEDGLRYDVLLLSGGVSAGKYDIVESVLASLGGEFYFDRVLIQPGQPLVFGRVGRTFVFGLPGNPASTMVTFEVFARAAVELLAGQPESILPLGWARLATEFRHKPGLTRFLPARLSSLTGELTPLPSQGSSDVAALARSNCFLVADPARETWQAGDFIQVLMQ